MAGIKTGVTIREVTLALKSIQSRLAERKKDETVVIHSTGIDIVYSDMFGTQKTTFVDTAEFVSKLAKESQAINLEAEIIEQIFNCYPRRRDVGAAKLAIKRALWDEAIPCKPHERPLFLAVATAMYAVACARESKDKTFIPYPATWYNRKSYLNAANTARALIAQSPSNPDLPLKHQAELIAAQSALPKDAWTQRVEASTSSAPDTSASSQGES